MTKWKRAQSQASGMSQLSGWKMNVLPSLHELGLAAGTDKASRHNYLHAYQAALEAHRSTADLVVEIGVKDGASLRMWKRYFSKARIIGIDIQPRCIDHVEERIAVHIGEQTDTAFLDATLGGARPDVIIDDGSHRWTHQIETFLHLFPKLAPEGVYVIEDLQTSHVTLASRYGEAGKETAVHYLGRLAASVMATGDIPDAPSDPVLEAIRKTIEQVTLGQRYCILKKKR
ncbi:class I SAM-dependent methyltransferase [Sphingomonas sp. ID0503]|uniref:class I SAM-dependent methyltransferase n=1 Tax=Sphingomonas sp. ID0503 TaxID=3399691 RepID=UPI003AFAEF09